MVKYISAAVALYRQRWSMSVCVYVCVLTIVEDVEKQNRSRRRCDDLDLGHLSRLLAYIVFVLRPEAHYASQFLSCISSVRDSVGGLLKLYARANSYRV